MYRLLATHINPNLPELSYDEQFALTSASSDKLCECFDGGNGIYAYKEDADGEGEVLQIRLSDEATRQEWDEARRKAVHFAGVGGVMGDFSNENGCEGYQVVTEKDFAEVGLEPLWWVDPRRELLAEAAMLGLGDWVARDFFEAGRRAWVSLVGNIERAYGGPEEGGWHYDCGERLCILFADRLEQIASHEKYLREAYAEQLEQNGGYWGRVETSFGGEMPSRYYPEQRPHYE